MRDFPDVHRNIVKQINQKGETKPKLALGELNILLEQEMFAGSRISYSVLGLFRIRFEIRGEQLELGWVGLGGDGPGKFPAPVDAPRSYYI